MYIYKMIRYDNYETTGKLNSYFLIARFIDRLFIPGLTRPLFGS